MQRVVVRTPRQVRRVERTAVVPAEVLWPKAEPVATAERAVPAELLSPQLPRSRSSVAVAPGRTAPEGQVSAVCEVTAVALST
jgi:hypothetical protein